MNVLKLFLTVLVFSFILPILSVFLVPALVTMVVVLGVRHLATRGGKMMNELAGKT